MALLKKDIVDLSTITAGTPRYYYIAKANLLRCSIEIEQESVSAAGVKLKLVESNSQINWFDLLNGTGAVISYTTVSATEKVLLKSEWIYSEFIGIEVDVTAATTGTLTIHYNERANT